MKVVVFWLLGDHSRDLACTVLPELKLVLCSMVSRLFVEEFADLYEPSDYCFK